LAFSITLAERNVRVSADITHIPDCEGDGRALEMENAKPVTVHLPLGGSAESRVGGHRSSH
jgi:hypothetical protein